MGRFRRVLRDALVRGKSERFEIRLSARLEVLFQEIVCRREAIREIEDVLRLAIALEGTLESPTAALMIRAWLLAQPGAKALLRTIVGNHGAREVANRFARFEGRRSPPMHVAMRSPEVIDGNRRRHERRWR
jgi:hypothetical protein